MSIMLASARSAPYLPAFPGAGRRLSPPALAAVLGLHALVLLGMMAGQSPTMPPEQPVVMMSLVQPLEAPSPEFKPPPAQAQPKRQTKVPAPAPAPKAAMRPPAPQPILAAPPVPSAEPVRSVEATRPVEAAEPKQPVKPVAEAVAQVHDSAPAVSKAVPAPQPVVAPRFDADYLDNPSPVYPPLSRREGEEGTVMLSVYVEASGQAGKVELARSSGFDRLDRAALAAVKRWRFVPARRGSEAVADWVRVPIVFSLKE